MSIEHEEVIRSFHQAAVTGENTHWDTAQVEQFLGYMTPDARYHVSAWQEPLVGHDAIREELLRQAPLFTDSSFEFLNFAFADSTVFLERIDWCTINGNRAGFHVVGVYEVIDGKIASWRDYYDSAEIRAKIGRFTPATTAAPQG
jgi:limonene-1,2-epoxide hydrolase